jgi:hypothetical protein
MTVPYTFASAASPIPLSELDANFATPITLGSSAMILGGTYTSISGLTLTSPTFTNPTISGTTTIGGFSIQTSSNKLYFYYGATAIASLDSSGNLTTLGNNVAAGTP